MIYQILKLQLVEASNITLKDGTKKVKYLFVDKDGEAIIGYDPKQSEGGQWAKEAKDWDGKMESLVLTDWKWVKKEFQGKFSLKLVGKA